MKSKKKIKKEKSEKIMDKDGKFCVYEIFSQKHKTIYYTRGGQEKFLTKIVLDGYKTLPSGLFLNKNGYGFGKKGYFLLETLKKNLANNKILNLIISSKNKKQIKNGSHIITITIPYQDIHDVLLALGRINEDKNQEIRNSVASFLTTKFPKAFKISSENFDDYKGGEIAAILRRKSVVKKINQEDLESIKSFFPKIFESSLGNKKILKSIRYDLIKSTKITTDKIFLDEVIKEFNINLSKKTLKEESWQIFLRDKVFKFLSNYITSIEKQNVSVDVSYPDFVLVDVNNFIDVFEIKRHDTKLLSFDSDHENYYWKPEIAQAISQIENYIDNIVHNSDDYIKAIKRKKSIDIKIVRPRGYIIAGSSKQFTKEKEFEDFRKLGMSLKNINFILYDELLNGLKNLRSKL